MHSRRWTEPPAELESSSDSDLEAPEHTTSNAVGPRGTHGDPHSDTDALAPPTPSATATTSPVSYINLCGQ